MKKLPLVIVILLLLVVVGGSAMAYIKYFQKIEKETGEPQTCTQEYTPVCGKNGTTYGNKCQANVAKVEIAYEGGCIKDGTTDCLKDSDCPQNCPIDTVASCTNGKCICGNTYPKPTDCQNLWWFDNTHILCQQKQFCGAYMYHGLQTFTTKAKCQSAVIGITGSLYPKTEVACSEQQGGAWGRYGLTLNEWCNIKTTDAGKICTDVSQCQGTCFGENELSISGKCSEWLATFGCNAILQNGKVDGTLCTD